MMTVEEAIAAVREAAAAPEDAPVRLRLTRVMTAAEVLADELKRISVVELRDKVADEPLVLWCRPGGGE